MGATLLEKMPSDGEHSNLPPALARITEALVELHPQTLPVGHAFWGIVGFGAAEYGWKAIGAVLLATAWVCDAMDRSETKHPTTRHFYLRQCVSALLCSTTFLSVARAISSPSTLLWFPRIAVLAPQAAYFVSLWQSHWPTDHALPGLPRKLSVLPLSLLLLRGLRLDMGLVEAGVGDAILYGAILLWSIATGWVAARERHTQPSSLGILAAHIFLATITRTSSSSDLAVALTFLALAAAQRGRAIRGGDKILWAWPLVLHGVPAYFEMNLEESSETVHRGSRSLAVLSITSLGVVAYYYCSVMEGGRTSPGSPKKPEVEMVPVGMAEVEPEPVVPTYPNLLDRIESQILTDTMKELIWTAIPLRHKLKDWRLAYCFEKGCRAASVIQ